VGGFVGVYKSVKIKCISDYDTPTGAKAKLYLKVGKKYTLDNVEVHSYYTKIYLKEFPGIPFNSVHFKINLEPYFEEWSKENQEY
jgi:hypothetical protein